jgi:hypothetical protein
MIKLDPAFAVEPGDVVKIPEPTRPNPDTAFGTVSGT